MKHLINLLIFVFMFQGVFSQVENTETLKIIGKSKKILVPDIVTFSFELTVKDKNQASAQTLLIQETNKLIDKIKVLGYNTSDIKLRSFDIEEDWDYSGDKSKKVGYIATNKLELSFNYEPIKVSGFIDSIGKSNFKYMDYSLKLEVSESLKNSTRDILIQSAIENARHNAETISKSANIILDGITNMEYRDLIFNFVSNSDLPPPPPPIYAAQISKSYNSKLNLEYISLNEMEVYEEVIIIWKIKNVR